MITTEHAQLMARYNRWMNEKIYAASERLSDEERKADRGAFFKSIHSTLNHLLWADYTWLGRFAEGAAFVRDYPKVASGIDIYQDWEQLKAARISMDADICAWSATLENEWLARDFSWYSGSSKSTRTKPAWVLVAHLFNHQTHHRAQVTTLLSQRGIDPGVTDLMALPD
jgi:uncharacterized damage-inducible protein DinB